MADEKLIGGAVDHSEEGIDGAAQIQAGSEWSAFDEQLHQTFLGESSTLMIFTD